MQLLYQPNMDFSIFLTTKWRQRSIYNNIRKRLRHTNVYYSNDYYSLTFEQKNRKDHGIFFKNTLTKGLVVEWKRECKSLKVVRSS